LGKLERTRLRGEWIRTFAIITTYSNELVADIHDRMPVILAPADHARWLAEEPDPRDLMRPFPADLMRMWPISTRVNKPENDDPSIIEPIEPDTDNPAQPRRPYHSEHGAVRRFSRRDCAQHPAFRMTVGTREIYRRGQRGIGGRSPATPKFLRTWDHFLMGSGSLGGVIRRYAASAIP
jgi:hypothetical protein